MPESGDKLTLLFSLGDADPGEEGYGNVYVTTGQALVTYRARLDQRDDLKDEG